MLLEQLMWCLRLFHTQLPALVSSHTRCHMPFGLLRCGAAANGERLSARPRARRVLVRLGSVGSNSLSLELECRPFKSLSIPSSARRRGPRLCSAVPRRCGD